MATAGQLTVIILAAVCLTTLHGGGVSGQMSPASAPSGEDVCMNVLLNVTDCLTYVEAGSNLTVPDKPCCGEVAGLLESNPLCLCELLAKGNSFGISIDLNKALKLASVCKLSTPPLSTCSLVGVPIGVPVGVPMSSEQPMSPGVQPPGGAASSPTAGKDNNGIARIADSSRTCLVGFAIAFTSTIFFLF